MVNPISITVSLGSEIAIAAFETALHQNKLGRGNFFHEIRKAVKSEIAATLTSHGIITDSTVDGDEYHYFHDNNVFPLSPIIKYTGWNNDIREELDMNFCKRYGYDEDSLGAINYIDRGYCELPSLMPFMTIESLSLGNIILQIENKGYKVGLEFESGVQAVGYACDATRKKQKSYIGIFGIWFSKKLIESIVDKLGIEFGFNPFNLDECRIDVISFPIIYIDRVTGKLYTCSCFSNCFDIEDDLVRCLPYGGRESEPILLNAVRSIKFADGICHLCTGGVPKLKYGSSMYYSSFLQSYLPYNTLYCKNKIGGEDELRMKFGYPKVGEKWITETLLYKIIQTLFVGTEVIHHYRCTELQGLELDIWVPKPSLAIEYQGEQHYQVVEHWGGKEGLKQRIANDKKKKQLCKQAGYHLIEFRYDENISEGLVLKKLCQFLPNGESV